SWTCSRWSPATWACRARSTTDHGAGAAVAAGVAGRTLVQRARAADARLAARSRRGAGGIPDVVPGLRLARPAAGAARAAPVSRRTGDGGRAAHRVRAPRGDDAGGAAGLPARVPDRFPGGRGPAVRRRPGTLDHARLWPAR